MCACPGEQHRWRGRHQDQDVFFLCERDGGVPLEGKHGFGLYYHDCRLLNGYELMLAGTKASSLVGTAKRGLMATLELTNPDIRMAGGGLIPKETIGIKWERVIDGTKLALYDLITFQNFGRQSAELPVSLTFQARFEDVFSVRGLLPKRGSLLRPPGWEDEVGSK